MAETRVSDEKRRLIEESERYRQAITGEFKNLRSATAWLPRSIGVVRAVSPLLGLSLPVLGLFWRKKKKPEPKMERDGKSQGLVAKIFLAFELLRKARPFWETFQRSRHRVSPNSKATSSPKAPAPRP